MDDREHQSFDDDIAPRGGLSARQIAIIGVVAIALLSAGVWLVTRPSKGPGTPEPRRVESVPEGTRNVTLYFADAEEAGIRAETRELAVGRRMDEQVRQIIDALISGPSDEKGISAIPAGTQLLSVMVDADSGTVYLTSAASSWPRIRTEAPRVLHRGLDRARKWGRISRLQSVQLRWTAPGNPSPDTCA
jgi:hypothetical protein